MAFTTENRLPDLGEIRKINRQGLKSLLRHKFPCYRCGVKLEPPRPVCFDDGHYSHLECSEDRNRELRELSRTFAIQDALEKGATSPCQPLMRLKAMTRATPLRPQIRQVA